MRFKRRKNFLATFLIAILFWGAWGWLVYFKPPINNFLIFSFCLLLFLALFLTAALIFANSRKGLFLACFVILALILRYYQIGNLLSLVLLASIFVILELYFTR